MTNVYYLPNTNTPITIETKLSCPGVSFSEADKEIPGGSSQFVADSSGKAVGEISKTTIATANELDGCIIEIDTIIELDTVDQDDWPSCYDNLTANYFFSGGINGDVMFICDDDDKKKSQTGKTITIAKMIQLTAKQ